jgi:ethanolamine utilization protein EutN
MYLAKVIGHVVAPQKTPELGGMKLMLVQPYITKDGQLVKGGSSVVAVDCVGAGIGECIMFTQGSSARLTTRTKGMPVDAVIVGIVDTVELEGKVLEKP